MITLEKIDELRKRANVSFEKAKEILEKYDGNLVEALIHLEKENKIRFSSGDGAKTLFDKVGAVINKGNNIRFIVTKNERTTLNLSLTVTVVIGALTFHVSAIALVIGMLTGYKFKFEKNTGEFMKVNSVLDTVQDNMNHLKKKFDEEILTKK